LLALANRTYVVVALWSCRHPSVLQIGRHDIDTEALESEPSVVGLQPVPDSRVNHSYLGYSPCGQCLRSRLLAGYYLLGHCQAAAVDLHSLGPSVAPS
jgi:hypothetical protein